MQQGNEPTLPSARELIRQGVINSPAPTQSTAPVNGINTPPQVRAEKLAEFQRTENRRPLNGNELLSAGVMGFQRDEAGKLFDPKAAA